MTTQRYFILAKCYDKRGKLLSTAFNSYERTHPVQKYFDATAGDCAAAIRERSANARARGN